MKKLSFLFAALLCAAMSFAEAKTYSYTFTVKTLNGTGEIALGDAKWTQAYDGTWYTGYDWTKGQQIGSKSNKVTAFSLTTNGISGTITKVVVNASIASDGNAKLAVKVGETDYIKSTSLTTTATDYTGTGTAAGTIVISYSQTTSKAFYIKSISITYELEEGAVSAPTFVTTETDFVDSTSVTLSADEGLDIYYTIDGTEPTATTGTKYAEPIAISKTTTIKAIAYNATTEKSSAVAEKTYTLRQLITECGDLVIADDNDFVELGKVTVVYVNGGNTYICDATGYGLLFKYSYGLEAGQEVEGIKGRVSIYNGLPEIIPSVEKADLTITEGTIPAPTIVTTVPTADDLNKYVRFNGVTTTAATWKSSDKDASARTLIAKLGENDLTLYNTFKIDQEFEARNYNIVGFVTCFNTTIQIAVVSAEPIYTVTATANDDNMGTVSGTGEYAKGAEVTLKATAKKGYQFVKWSDKETANPYTFTATEDVTLTAEFSVVPKHIYAYNLNSTLNDGSYTFTFYANEDATAANLIFYDATSGDPAGEVELLNVVKGANTHTIAADKLPGDNKQTMVWAVELEANPVNVFTMVYKDAAPAYRRGYANVDTNPESDFFGQVYVADRVKTKANSRLYVYSQDYVNKDANGYQLGESIWDFGRFGIAQDGTLYLSDYGDAHSGIYLVNPADLTQASQFFVGTRESTGLIKNGTVETGSSIAACSFVGTGANTKLVAVAEDYTDKSFPVVVFNVGNEDGTIATSWDAAPSKMFDTKGNMSQNFEIKGCEKGVWVAQSRADGQNNSSATSLRFYDWEGNCTWSASDHTDVINGSLGGVVALTANENQVILKADGTTIKVFDVTWAESTPTLTLAATYDCGYAAVSSINLDYAGNMVVVAGSAFSSTDDKQMSAAVFSVPTTSNICEVPAKKAMTVTKTTISTDMEDIHAAGVQVEKIVRDGQVLILVGGKTYNVMGQVVE